MQDWVPAWCDRCSQYFKVYWVKTVMASLELHKPDCHGCLKPDPLFKIENMELKPMEMPIGRIFDFDYEYGRKK